ncbi:MAG TPA: hypothetical protein VE861_13675, partial [Gemmatimonadaceae bacterium]|nr:hypothetical protein [Gemmatimonadaceae bacterium]
MTHHRSRCCTVLLATLLTACGETAPAARADSTNAATAPGGAPYAYDRIVLDTTRPPGTVIDSTFPMPELIRRFRIGLADPQGLVDGP